MRITTENVSIDNIIRFNKNKPLAKFYESILDRLCPKIYEKYGCIVVRCVGNCEREMKHIAFRLWNVGVICEEKAKLKDGLQVEDGILNDVREYEFRKIGAIKFTDNEHFEEHWNKLKYEVK